MDHVKHEFDLSKLKRKPVSKEVKVPPFMFPGWKAEERHTPYSTKSLKPDSVIDCPNRASIWLMREESWARITIKYDCIDQFWEISNDLFWPNSWQDSRKIMLEDLPSSYTVGDIVKATELKIFKILNEIVTNDFVDNSICLSMLGDKASAPTATALCNYISSVFRQPDNQDRW